MHRRWWTLLVVCAAMAMLLIDVNVVVIALPGVQRSLGASFGDLQWTTDAYALTLAASLLTAGCLADKYGRRRLFAAGLVVFTAGSLLCGLAPVPAVLVVSRAVQGVGGAIMSATSLALLAGAFRGRARGVAFGVWGAVAGVATGLGPVVGGLLTGGLGWRAIFLVNVPIGVAATVITLRRVDESRAPRAGRVDWPGLVTLTAGLFCLVYALVAAGGDQGGGPLWFVAAAVFLVAFAVVEWRGPDPMFDPALLRVPTFLGGSAAAFAMNGSLYALFLYLVLYLQNGLGAGPLVTGVRLLTGSAFTCVAAVAAGRLSSRVPVRWLIGPGLVLVGTGVLLMRDGTGHAGWTHLIPGLIVSGIGAGLVNPPLASTAVGVVPPRQSGMASGANQTFRQIGVAVGIAWYGARFSAALRHTLGERLAGVPGFSGRADEVAAAVRRGTSGEAVSAAPPELRDRLAGAVRAGFADALDDVLLVAGLVALAGGVLATVLIRTRDFAAQAPPEPGPARQVVASRNDSPTSGSSPSARPAK
jgi:EmrB/QacA subfamily drug resistance transporter